MTRHTTMIRAALLLATFILLASSGVQAATIMGSVYNLYFDQLNKAIVSIDTQPTQTMVSKGGAYKFDVPEGRYTLLAAYIDNGTTYSAKERLVVAQDGEYVIDLILIPELESDDTLDNLSQTEFIPFEQETSPIGLVLTIILVLFFLLYVILTKAHFLGDDAEHQKHPEQKKDVNKPHDEQPVKDEGADLNDEEKLMNFIKEQGGRVTQKDIRKRFPLSEAKVSLVIADLESQGKIKKIKKGRNNIIILNE